MKQHLAVFQLFALCAFAAVIRRQTTCPPNFKNIVFGGGFSPAQFDQIGAADRWIDFAMDPPAGASAKTEASFIHMMSFQRDVAEAVALVNGPNPPEWLITFNEPDFSWGGITPTMTPQEAAAAIQPLLQSPGTKTKFVAPSVAFPDSQWLPSFYASCNCYAFFAAINLHIYLPTSAAAINDIQVFHDKFPDKPIWVTELAPGNAIPQCSISYADTGAFMTQIYSWSARSGFVDRIFWNSGNFEGQDPNLCNSNLLDQNSNPTPLLATFQGLDCA